MRKSEISGEVWINSNARSFTPDPITSEAQAFHESMPGYSPTKLISVPELARELGVGSVFIKDESERFGLPAFKALGATWAIDKALRAHALNSGDSFPTLVTATDGNHGRAVANTAKKRGLSARIYIPHTVSEAAITAIEREGAEVHVLEEDYDSVVQIAATDSRETGALLIQDTAWEGYTDIPGWIVEGYTTMLAEVDDQLAQRSLQATHVLVPTGVGSLLQAVLSHYRGQGTHAAHVISVEPDTAGCILASVRAQALTAVPTAHTIMSGLNCGTPSALAWPLIRQGLSAAVVVTDEQAIDSLEYLTHRGIAVGPCGAAALSGIRVLTDKKSTREQLTLDKDSVVVLLSTESIEANPLVQCASPDRALSGDCLDLDDPTDLTRALIRIDSVNPDLVAGASGESAIAGFVRDWLTTRGFAVHTLEKNAGRPTIVGVSAGTGSGESIMLNGHIDTVSLASYDSDEGLLDRIDDGNIYGRGSFDMKSGVAAMMIAAHKASEHPHRGDIIVTLVADEEYASSGTEEVLAAGFTAHGAIVTEPMNLDITIAHRGFLWFEVDILGVAAHGSRPELGIDAIVKAGTFLTALGELGEKLRAGDQHPLLATGSIHASTITGGEELSSYPALCTIGIERRTIPGETRESCTAELVGILEALAEKDADFTYSLRTLFERPTFAVDPTARIVSVLRESFAEVTQSEPTIRGEAFWADAALLHAAGIPSVLFGVDGAGAHAAIEWTTISSLQIVTHTLERTIREFTA